MMPKYYWIPTLIVLALFMTYFGVQAWHYINTPLVLDYIWIEGKLTPVTLPQSPNSWNILFMLPSMFTIWWHLPLYIFIPFNIFVAWCAFLIVAYRPCIDVGWSNSERKKT